MGSLLPRWETPKTSEEKEKDRGTPALNSITKEKVKNTRTDEEINPMFIYIKRVPNEW